MPPTTSTAPTTATASTTFSRQPAPFAAASTSTAPSSPRSSRSASASPSRPRPGGGQARPWHFMVVTDEAKRDAIGGLYREGFYQFAGARPMRPVIAYLADNIHRCPVLIIPCIEGRAENDGQGAQASLYGQILPAAWSLQMALRTRGLGTAWTGIHLRYAERGRRTSSPSPTPSARRPSSPSPTSPATTTSSPSSARPFPRSSTGMPGVPATSPSPDAAGQTWSLRRIGDPLIEALPLRRRRDGHARVELRLEPHVEPSRVAASGLGAVLRTHLKEHPERSRPLSS